MNKAYRQVYKEGIGWVAVAENASCKSKLSSKKSRILNKAMADFSYMKKLSLATIAAMLMGGGIVAPTNLFAATKTYIIKDKDNDEIKDRGYIKANNQTVGIINYTDGNIAQPDPLSKTHQSVLIGNEILVGTNGVTGSVAIGTDDNGYNNKNNFDGALRTVIPVLNYTATGKVDDGSFIKTGVGGSAAVAIGGHTQAQKDRSIAMGTYSLSGGTESISIGTVNWAGTNKSIAFGTNNYIYNGGENSMAFGHGNKVTGKNSHVVGAANTITQNNSFIFGNSSKATAAQALGLGEKVEVSVTDGVALGAYSNANRKALEDADKKAVYLGSDSGVSSTVSSTKGALSIGSSSFNRQIINVAAGKENSDAVNVAQLKGAMSNVNKILGSTLNNDGTMKAPEFKAFKNDPNKNNKTYADAINANTAVLDDYEKNGFFNIKKENENNKFAVKPKGEVKFNTDTNINLEVADNDKKGAAIKHTLNPNLTGIESIKGNGGTISLKGGSIDMGGSKITNVKEGDSEGDAVTYKQLKNLDDKITNMKIDNLVKLTTESPMSFVLKDKDGKTIQLARKEDPADKKTKFYKLGNDGKFSEAVTDGNGKFTKNMAKQLGDENNLDIKDRIIISTINPDGKVGHPTKISKVADGRVSPESDEAINGSQLYDTHKVFGANDGQNGKDKIVVLDGQGKLAKKDGDKNVSPFKGIITAQLDSKGQPLIDDNGKVKTISTNDGNNNVAKNYLEVMDEVADAINKGFYTQANVPVKDFDSNRVKHQLGSTIKVTGKSNLDIAELSGENLKTSIEKDGSINLLMSKSPRFKEITVGAKDDDPNSGIKISQGKDWGNGVKTLNFGDDNSKIRLGNLADGVNDTDAVTKRQLDTVRRLAQNSHGGSGGKGDTIINKTIVQGSPIADKLIGGSVKDKDGKDVKFVDEKGNLTPAGKDALTTNSATGKDVPNTNIIQAINNINKHGTKFFHVNDGTEPIGKPSGENSKDSKANATGGVAIGMNAVVTDKAPNGVAIGTGAKTEVSGGVALGEDSVANRLTSLDGYIPKGASIDQEKAIKDTIKGNLGVVSVGKFDKDGNLLASRQITGVAAGKEDFDAVNVAQLKAVSKEATKWISSNDKRYDKNGKVVDNNIPAKAEGINSVAIGAGSNTKVVSADGKISQRNNTVSVGGVNPDGTINTRTISNVAPGELDSDVATMGQLRSGLNNVYNKLGEYKKRASAGTASAMAIGNMPQSTIPGKGMVSLGSGFYDGQSAMAIGLSKMSDDGKWVVKGSASYDSQEKAGAALSVGFHF